MKDFNYEPSDSASNSAILILSVILLSAPIFVQCLFAVYTAMRSYLPRHRIRDLDVLMDNIAEIMRNACKPEGVPLSHHAIVQEVNRYEHIFLVCCPAKAHQGI